jgi:hypothetical protein
MTNYILTCDAPDSVAQRVRQRYIQDENGCHRWAGRVDRYGYGRFKMVCDGVKRETGAHRAAWLSMVGDIPQGLVIDHLCRTRSCVNPEHMELVTNEENVRRGIGVGRPPRPLGERATCAKHGPERGSFQTRKSGYVVWCCRDCIAERVARWKLKKAGQ